MGYWKRVVRRALSEARADLNWKTAAGVFGAVVGVVGLAAALAIGAESPEGAAVTIAVAAVTAIGVFLIKIAALPGRIEAETAAAHQATLDLERQQCREQVQGLRARLQAAENPQAPADYDQSIYQGQRRVAHVALAIEGDGGQWRLNLDDAAAFDMRRPFWFRNGLYAPGGADQFIGMQIGHAPNRLLGLKGLPLGRWPDLKPF